MGNIWVLFFFRIIILLFPTGFPVLQYPFLSPNQSHPYLLSPPLRLLQTRIPRCHKHSRILRVYESNLPIPRCVSFFLSQNSSSSLAWFWFGTDTNTHNTVLFRHYISRQAEMVAMEIVERTYTPSFWPWCVEI